MADGAENIRDLLIEDEVKDSYLTYAMSVIVSRALPDVRDGFKPSQRRILAAMNDLGLNPRSKFVKCAKIVGECMGKYHPHGDSAIYPTLVRLAQDFSTRYLLIKPQGNFGSIDGDPPAAMRYTEAKLAEPAMMLLEDLDKDTVDFAPNYDESTTEPTVLPAKFPNLLCNGSQGIAVGMATSIPPHNLTEVCDALIALLDNPEIPILGLMQHVKGPDFPTGGLICGRRGIAEAYAGGKGRVTVRARMIVEETKTGRKMIIVTEIPYQLQKTAIIERIAEVVNDGRVEGIHNVQDESDKDGMRLVIELKKGVDDRVVMNQLYAFTPLEDTFSIIMIALVNSRPKTLNLKEILEYYRDHRIVVIRRRTRFLLDKAEKRAHILEGLLKALDIIDEVIATIRASESVAAAHDNLMSRFGFTDPQAEAILEMKLQKLAALEREKLLEEYKKLMEEIEYYRRVLADENLVLDIIREDLFELKEKFGDARRTEIVGDAEDINIEDLIEEETVAVTVSHDGYAKRQPLTTYRKQHRGGRGVTGAETKEGDWIERLFTASTHDYILFFTDRGQVHWVKVYDIPELARTAKGRALVNMIQLQEGEKITSMFPVRNFDEGDLFMATDRGTVKKTALAAFGNPKKTGIRAINLEEGEKLIGVALTLEGQEVMLATDLGYAIRFPGSAVREMGRTAHGVRGITLREGDSVRSLVVVDTNATILTVCENGFGKRTPFEEYRITHRGGKGIINIQATERNGKVVAVMTVSDDDDIMVITQQGMIVRTPVRGMRAIGRNTQGVTIMKLDEGDLVVSVARVVREDEAEGDATTDGAPDVGPSSNGGGNDGSS
ncbi:MAG: DNA gyrase subunit A [Planctomycetes bacterium]|nr:DNA gyrase subunit A [Planctomycetota bacterium]